MSICVITPRLPPAMDGLGDYCYQMWQNWPSEMEKPSKYLVLEGAADSSAIWKDVSIKEFAASELGLSAALEASGCNIAFLQYVGYGFDINGCPMWLPAALKTWLENNNSRQLVIMFHETWSSGKPWQKVFWYMGKQKQCVRELAFLANKIGTSCQVNRDSLNRIGIKKDIKIIPLGCSFPVIASVNKNWKKLLIFGKEYARARGIHVHHKLIQQLINKQLIDGIVLAGQKTSPKDPAHDLLRTYITPEVDPNMNLTIFQEYNFTGEAVPAAVIECGLSLMHTQSTHLLKSTSFHLAAKLGQIPIAVDSGPLDPPFVVGKHCLAYQAPETDQLLNSLEPDQLLSMSMELEELSATYLSWKHIAEAWANLFTSPPA